MASESRAVRARGIRRRQELLDACIRLIARRGISGVTHRAVAAEAGVPSSSTTYFFDSLDDLIAEAVEAAMDAELERIRRLESSVGTGQRPAGDTIAEFVRHIRDVPAPHTVAQFEMYLFASRTPQLQARVAEIIRATRDVATDAAHRQGVFDPTVGDAIVAMIDGFALHQVADPSPGRYEAMRTALTALTVGYAALEGSRHLSSPPADE